MKKIKTTEDLKNNKKYQDLVKNFDNLIQRLEKNKECIVGEAYYTSKTEDLIMKSIKSLNKLEKFIVIYEELHFGAKYDTSPLYEELEKKELRLSKAIVKSINSRLEVY